VGIHSTRFDLAADCPHNELFGLIKRLNGDPTVDGILVQLPLPKSFDAEAVLDAISPEKDPDGLHFQNVGLMWVGRPRVRSCTPWGVMKILEHYKIPISGKKAVVVGRSNIVGKPMANLLMEAQATVTICHSKTADLRKETLDADIVVMAAGKPRMAGRDHFKKGAVVVDVGIHRLPDGKLCGDVKFEELDGWASAATPVPGGVGPMTIQMLLENTLELAKLGK
jgi:methylenetetrahydrofolate dehydrogenase (NADP+) / methenyltetrahydrofolate cyclohydrolase